MNDRQTTLFIGYNFFNLPESVFLVDPYTRTFFRGGVASNVNCDELVRKLKHEIAGLQVWGFRVSLNAEKSLFLAFSLFCKDLSKAYKLMDYADYINRNRKLVTYTGMQVVMWQSGSRLFNDTFVVNTETGDYWNGNLITTALKELNMTLTGAKRSRRFQNYINKYPTLLSDRFGDNHVTVFEDETGVIMHFYAETDRFTRELQLEETDNKAKKMTLAEFLERYDNKKGTK